MEIEPGTAFDSRTVCELAILGDVESEQRAKQDDRRDDRRVLYREERAALNEEKEAARRVREAAAAGVGKRREAQMASR